MNPGSVRAGRVASVPTAVGARTACAALALACAVPGAWLALHHPLSGTVAGAAFALAAAAVAVWPPCWLVALPALLPWLGLYPWTGWLTVEEFDLAVLAVAAGGYARLAWSGRPAGTPPVATPPRNGLQVLWWLLFMAALAISLQRGIEGAGGLHVGWWQGYREPMNAIRLGKSFVLASLLWPLAMLQLHASERAAMRLATGLALGLAAASLAALWERIAFTNLLDFSTDYRTTALFWEMHVGGAALDAFLALGFPFALLLLLRARSLGQWLLAGAALLLGGYACVTTFSRAVYVAVPLGIVVMLGLRALQHRARGRTRASTTAPAWPAAVALTIGFVAAVAWAFPGSGYRGLLALLGSTALLLRLAPPLRSLRTTDLAAGLGLGALAAAAAWVVASRLDKGAYVAWAVAWAVTAVAAWRGATVPGRGAAMVALAGFVATAASVALVARHWGAEAGLERTLPGVAFLAAGLWVARLPRSAPWPASARWQATLLGTMAGIGFLVATFSGGAYMGDRMAAGSEDLVTRARHWQRGVDLLQGPHEWSFGEGLGRFPDGMFYSGDPDYRTGDYRLESTAQGPRMVLTGGTYVLGWGEMTRLSQRIALPAGRLHVRFQARARAPVKLHLEVCEKHLLYNRTCATGAVMVTHGGTGAAVAMETPGMNTTSTMATPMPTGAKATPDADAWQPFELDLSDERLTRGHRLAPRLIAFSTAVESSGGRVEIGALSLRDADGRELLANGDFSNGMAHWFFSSDRYHLPWHAKNLEVHLLSEQGVVGLALFALMVLAALWRVAFGGARGHPLSPAIAAAIVGALVVALTDSMLDAPRVACLFYLLSMVGLALRAPPTVSR